MDAYPFKSSSCPSIMDGCVQLWCPIVTIKNILGHVSVQTTQIYAEMSQDTVDRKLKEWNETWFGNNQKIDVKKATDNIPEFLKKR